MAPTEQLSLSWDAHQKSICNGLSLLQQRGEFVDMTLAADGHHVKVHQMVMSLVSPYIKDLISTAQCPHPIIFLNNISYTTLCGILEYIYTGEVLVPKHRLPDLIAAGKALHIRGLREMDEQTADPDSISTANTSPPRTKSISEKLRSLGEKKKTAPTKEGKYTPVPMCKIYLEERSMDTEDLITETQDSTMDTRDESIAVGDAHETSYETPKQSNNGLGESDTSQELTPELKRKTLINKKVQYTVSNQGGLQMIYNRYIYQLRYISKHRVISWRCVDYNKSRCSATIFTNDYDEVIRRITSHKHPFHDKQILKRVRIGIIYSKFTEASTSDHKKKTYPNEIASGMSTKVQYSITNQGGLQVIHNRFIYHLRYCGKKNRKRLWRCIDYSSNLKCPANLCTDESNEVTERSFTHNHGFHDTKILKKLQNGIIYAVFHEAESTADGKKKERRVPCSVTAADPSESE